MNDYSALRRLAHEASETEMGWLDRQWLASIMADDWADYVAAIDPQVVIDLIDENDRLSGECEGWPMAIAEELRSERDQLKAENEALRKDLAGWKEVVAAVKREVPERFTSHARGNAPGHGHSVSGVWDDDNGALAGKECAWCKAWNAAMSQGEQA